MKTDDFFKELKLPIEIEVLNNINNYIDECKYRDSDERIVDSAFLNTCYGIDYRKNYADRIKKGPGKNECSFIGMPHELYINSNLDFIINKLKTTYQYIEPFIFKVPPQYFLNWHVDLARTCSINIPLDNDSLDTSITMFSSEIADENLVSMNTRFTKVSYNTGSMYLLNVARYHCVVNHGDKNRFSVIVVWNSNNDPYEKIFNFLKQDGLL